MWAIICYGTIGFVVGCIYALLYINFDQSWKKILSFLFSFGGSSCFLVFINNYFEVTDQTEKFKTATALFGLLFIGFVFLMIIMCKLIRDKDDDDILRIRDILLGQKSYIDKYYTMRMKEIDEKKLKLPMLEKRDTELKRKEQILRDKETFLEEENRKLKELGRKKLKLNIPIDSQVLISEKFIKLMPSFIDDFSKFIHQIDIIKAGINLNANSSLKNVKSCLLVFATCMSKMVFGGNNDVRVHFRYFNEENELYEELISIIGTKSTNHKLTPIPYEDSMIKKSYETKRCLLKSVNSEYDYKSNNYTKWKDYITYAFYMCIRKNKPYLTFGISVKNEERYKDIFYFLNYIEIESCLDDYIMSITDKTDLEKIIYKAGVINE